MPQPMPEQDRLLTFILRLSFEGAHQPKLELSGYLFDANGTLIEGADIWRDELQLTAMEREFAAGTLLIAPCPTRAFDGATPTAETLLARQAFQPRLSPVPGQRDYRLPDIPEALWRHWTQSAPPGAPQREEGDADFLFV